MKNTKRALFMSVLSMLLCIAMLAGSTFAWFTDSVTSGKNTIVAGNLDIELYYKPLNGVFPEGVEKDEDDFGHVTDKTSIFQEGALWEPGRVEVVYLKVKNVGSLALKYALGINKAGFTAGHRILTPNEFEKLTNEEKVGYKGVKGDDDKVVEYDKSIDLANYLKFAVVKGTEDFLTAAEGEPEGTTPRDRALALAEANNAGWISELALSGEGELCPKGKEVGATGDNAALNSSEVLTLIVYMPWQVGNEANYRLRADDMTAIANIEKATDKTDKVKEDEINTVLEGYVPTIDLGVNVFATQTPYESDSFDKDYDKNAWNDWFEKNKVTYDKDSGTYLGLDGETIYVKSSGDFIEVTPGTDPNGKEVEGLYVDAENNNYVASEDAIQSVVENVEEGEPAEVTVLTDITLSNRITAKGDLTIKGEGKQLIVKRTSDSSDRVIDLSETTGKTTITLDKVDLVGPETGSYNRGVSLYGNKDVTVILNDCSVSTNYYALNVAGANEDVAVVIKNTDLTGYAAINLWSTSDITLENCTLTGVNHWGESQSNNFAVVVFNSGSADSVLKCKGCTFVSDTLDNAEYFFSVGVENVKITLEGCNFKYNGADVTDDVKADFENAQGESAYVSDYLKWYEGTNPVFTIIE